MPSAICLDVAFGAVENAVLVKVAEPTEAKVFNEEPKIDIKPEPTDDGELTVDENRASDLADTTQSSEQDCCVFVADSTGSTDSSTINTAARLPRRKRARKRKSGLNLLMSSRPISLYDEKHTFNILRFDLGELGHTTSVRWDFFLPCTAIIDLGGNRNWIALVKRPLH